MVPVVFHTVFFRNKEVMFLSILHLLIVHTFYILMREELFIYSLFCVFKNFFSDIHISLRANIWDI